MPSAVDPVAADECTSIAGAIDSGSSGVPFASHEPTRPRYLAAKCEDETVCTAEVRERDVLVRGKAPGETFVLVQHEHPITGERGESRVRVSFTPIPRSDPLHPRMVGAHACPKGNR
jgi:hypothetical protein